MRELPEGWVERMLGKHCLKIGSGSTPRGGNEAYKKEGISLIRSQNILDFDFSYKGLAFIDDEQASKLSNVEIFEDDVLINITGDSVARVCSVPKEALPARVNQHVAILRTNKQELNSVFLRYYLLNPIFKRHLLILANSGGTRNALTKNMLEMLELNLPPLTEQKAIADMLSSFDDKIELLREQNKTLETLAQTIFKEWFVHFNFPNPHGKPYSNNGGEMVESELGLIPKVWRVVTLRELSDKISKGTTPRKKELEELPRTTPFLKVKDVSNEGVIKLGSLEKIPQEVHKKALSRSRLVAKDILFSIAGTIGRVTILPESLNDSNCNQALAFIRLSSKEKFLEYVHQWIKTPEIQFEIKSNIVQGVQANVSLTVLGDLKIVIPSDLITNTWREVIQPVYQKLDNNRIQIQTLSKTRNTLLPKLMSGEVRLYG